MIHPYYPHLFSPLKINRLVLKNRIFYAPVEYYHDRALAGAGVMMRGTSGTLKDQHCRISKGSGWMFDGKNIQKTKDELLLIRRNGSLTSLEVMHAGNLANPPEGDFVYGPSAGTNKYGLPIREMDRADMDHIIGEFVETVLKAKQIGYDMCMLHYAHCWLPSQFMAPGINKRTDEYGGSYENRVRFPKEILRAVRKAVGKDYPLDMRISYYENFDGCMPQDEVARFVKEVAEEGLINCVNVSFGGHLAKGALASPGSFTPDCCFVEGGAKIKEAVGDLIPVVIVGKIMTPEEAEDIIASGKADAVVIGRASIADPYWAKKAFEGRSRDIVPCIHCGKCFSLRCTMNLRGYYEHLVPAEVPVARNKETVVVIGGGPAGMNAAIFAHQAGHRVILYEAGKQLGGLVRIAGLDKYKKELKDYTEYLVNQLSYTDVDVRLNTKATADKVREDDPDRIILAMGSVPTTPRIPGAEYAMQAVDAHEKQDEIGKRAVIIGGGLTGSEFACSLTSLSLKPPTKSEARAWI